ncbi:MAG: cytochrome c nitrite reductase small subunit [Propionibacteriaceae bacterium]|jgi:cytochrome c nitrite reductase small subunit|nr:cytochrome c nitrite reductase small subunit [Propionibacteriaceae bacterium]
MMARAATPVTTARRVLSIVAAVLCGCAVGVGVFGLGYSDMPSYLSSDPLTCTNCHVMQEQYDAWSRGSHANVATCDDCHLPHDNLVHKYMVQAEDGLLHGYKFTTGDYPTNIVIRESSLEVANSSCVYCHEAMTNDLHYSLRPGETITCTHCHSNVGHD